MLMSMMATSGAFSLPSAVLLARPRPRRQLEILAFQVMPSVLGGSGHDHPQVKCVWASCHAQIMEFLRFQAIGWFLYFLGKDLMEFLRFQAIGWFPIFS